MNFPPIKVKFHPARDSATILRRENSCIARKAMISAEQFTITASDNCLLHVYSWPADRARAIVYLCHGMSEHGARYEDFGRFLNSHEVSLICMDQRGFGASQIDAHYGYFAASNGWQQLLEDHRQLLQLVIEKHPDVPIFLMGHSMGSYVAQSYLLNHPNVFTGLVLSASNQNKRSLLLLGQLAVRFEGLLRGWKRPSKLLDRMSFGKFNQAFEPARTAFDWLSRDERQVDLYVGDPLCGQPCSPKLWQDFLAALATLKPGCLQGLSPSLPILLFAGAADPAGGATGMKRLERALRLSDQRDVELRIYAEGRHEMLNESNREQVCTDLLTWLSSKLAAAQ